MRMLSSLGGALFAGTMPVALREGLAGGCHDPASSCDAPEGPGKEWSKTMSDQCNHPRAVGESRAFDRGGAAYLVRERRAQQPHDLPARISCRAAAARVVESDEPVDQGRATRLSHRRSAHISATGGVGGAYTKYRPRVVPACESCLWLGASVHRGPRTRRGRAARR